MEDEPKDTNKLLFRKIEVLETKVDLLERERKTLIEILFIILKKI